MVNDDDGKRLGYYRFPAIHNETVVFAGEGDLWCVNLQGGAGIRLTTHPGEESYPAFSPDGAMLAFSATYEGPMEVYVMPAAGGLPKRLTYEGGARVVGWTPDAKILYATEQYSTLPNTQLVALDPRIGGRSLIPLAQAAEGVYEPAGRTLFFTRFADQGSQTKRYRGGTAQNLWKFTKANGEAEPLTADYAGTSRRPMWWHQRVYFESDRDGTMNIWSMTEEGRELKQHTRHVGWEVKSSALHNGRIVYQLGADLCVYDIAAEEDRVIPVTLHSDFDQMRERWVERPMEYLSSWHVSPEGDRLVLTARGKVFVAPAKQGRWVEATRKHGVRYRSAHFLPEGKSLVVLSDESGEVEWWQLAADGIAAPKQVTDDSKVLRFDGLPSPDGKWLAHWNQDQELWLTEIETKQSKKIAFSSQWGFDSPAWSPDSRWFVYGKRAENSFMQLFLYDLREDKTAAITTDRFNSSSATWSPDGAWIYFLSDRHLNSLVGNPWGAWQPEPFLDQKEKIFALALRPGLRFPFQPANELQPKEPEKESVEASTAGNDKAKDKPAKEATDKNKEPIPEVTIELAGIERRLYEVPVPAGNYSDLVARDKRLFVIERETSLPRKAALMTLDISNESPKLKTLVDEICSYEVALHGKKLVVRKNGNFYVIETSSNTPAKLDETKVDLSSWGFSLDPKEDWRQVFVESWRLERDYFYDRGMHGADWKGMLEKYLPLVERVRSRGELADVQAQMASELSTLHIFVRGGDHREVPQNIEPASLGAWLTREEAAGGYRVEHVYRSDPDLPHELSPLAQPGVEVREGDIILTINGVPTLSVIEPRALLRKQSGKQVRLTVKPVEGNGTRDVIVYPLSNNRDEDLRYAEWEYTRRLMVEQLGRGDLGYVHLRAMSSENIAEWYREFYPVFNRRGLIMDVRHNYGGNIESWLLEKLLRKAWMYWQRRVGNPYWNMQYAFRGHMVVLVDEWTASDGEAFAEGFRRLGLGKVIGTRTWGGQIWLSRSNRLVDDGIVTAAETGVYGPEGKWLIEGHGVDPDLMVDNLPHATFNGEDAQLTAAVQHLQDLIRRDPRPVPQAPAYPDKSSQDNRRSSAKDENRP